MITTSADTPMPRFVHFKTPGFMSTFGGMPDDGVWINPDQVTSLELSRSGVTTICLAGGRSHTVEASVDEVIKKLNR